MNPILAIPLPFRVGLLFVVGVVLGSLVNLAAYRLAWRPRAISPWSLPDPKAPPRRWDDRIPIFGWLGLRREANLHGRGFWLRPIFVELLCGLGLAALYWWEVDQLALLPEPVPPRLAGQLMALVHVQVVCHAVLMGLMLVASLIDADEKIIPDTVTLPGTLFGLIMATVYPWALLPAEIVPGNQPAAIEVIPLWLTSPRDWSAMLNAAFGLAIALTLWWLWCIALMPRTWYTRHGLKRALGLSLARLRRHPASRWLAVLGLLGSAAIAGVWLLGGVHWQGLLTSLVGMAAGGGLVWSVRIVATAALKREAMGFGDVTLMAMIGTLVGWQSCPIVFFLAPFAGLAIALLGFILRREHEVAFGPYLSLAAAVLLVYWSAIWQHTIVYFAAGWLIPAAIVVVVVLMAVLLLLWRGVLSLVRLARARA